MVPVHVNKRFTLATIDEGSEINCMDESFAVKNKIGFVPTICTATAAGLTTMKLAGQTQEHVLMTIQGTQEPVTWNLGNMVVVQNLGNDILIGEPGKKDNKIITMPYSKSIEMISDVNNDPCLDKIAFSNNFMSAVSWQFSQNRQVRYNIF